MKSVLTFESMITPKIITFLYWLLLGVAVGGVAAMLSFGRLSFASFATGLLVMAGGRARGAHLVRAAYRAVQDQRAHADGVEAAVSACTPTIEKVDN